MILPVYILIRTSNRPVFFKNMMQSIKEQTYPNIITIVHTDDINDNYVEGDIILRSERNIETGRGFYNLYCNKLLDAISDIPGWYHFIDDDDMYASNNVIERLIEKSKINYMNVARVDRGNGFIWPKYWKEQNSFQGECIFLHTIHKDKARWISKKKADHNYTRKLAQILKINWIDDLIITKAQEGKGRGKRLDRGEA